MKLVDLTSVTTVNDARMLFCYLFKGLSHIWPCETQLRFLSKNNIFLCPSIWGIVRYFKRVIYYVEMATPLTKAKNQQVINDLPKL